MAIRYVGGWGSKRPSREPSRLFQLNVHMMWSSAGFGGALPRVRP